MATVELNSNQFKEFMRSMYIMKEMCNDIDLRNGQIRQRSNARDCIFELDLRSIIDLSFSITSIKKKLDLFDCFKDGVTIETNGVGDAGTHSVSDNISKLIFRNIPQNYLDNTYMSTDELFAALPAPDEENMVLNIDITPTVSTRIKKICRVFDVNAVTMNISSNKAKLSAITRGENERAVFFDNVDLISPMEECDINISMSPFIIDHDDNINLRIYKYESNGNLFTMNCFITKIGSIGITLYTRSNIR